MRPVAGMTMAFLHGTFFAAVFAIPSLNWNEHRIIQKKGLYPSLHRVGFPIWASLTYQSQILEWVETRVKAVGKTGDVLPQDREI
jgi:hypothetical protein